MDVSSDVARKDEADRPTIRRKRKRKSQKFISPSPTPDVPSVKLCATCGDGGQLGDQGQRQVMCSRTATGNVLSLRNCHVSSRNDGTHLAIAVFEAKDRSYRKVALRPQKTVKLGNLYGVLFAPTIWQFCVHTTNDKIKTK